MGRYAGCCVWCNVTEMERRCANQRLRKLLAYNLRVLDTMHARVGDEAIMRLPRARRDAIVVAALGMDVEERFDAQSKVLENDRDVLDC